MQRLWLLLLALMTVLPMRAAEMPAKPPIAGEVTLRAFEPGAGQNSPGQNYQVNLSWTAPTVPTGAAETWAVTGAVTAGTFQIGETVTQAGTGSTGIVDGIPLNASPPLPLLFANYMGTASATGVWTGGTSGATFTPNAAPVPAIVIAGYNVYRAVAGSSSYQLVNTPPVTSTAYTDTTVTNGVTYDYYVETVDTAGVSSVPSSVLMITIPGSAPQQPAPPTGLQGVPYYLSPG